MGHSRIVLPPETGEQPSLCVCVFITAVPITKLFVWGEGDSGGHVLLLLSLSLSLSVTVHVTSLQFLSRNASDY